MKVMFTLAVLAATLVHCSVAQRTHVVGDALGWTIPSGGAITYTNWASSQSFTAGDILVFNFPTGGHDVAEVTQASFDSCNTTNPISLTTNGPANITLKAAGEQFFICTFPQHCSRGQKLAINVSAAPSTAPPPAAAHPSPAPEPATPSSSPVPPPATSPTPEPATPSSSPVSPPATSTAPEPATPSSSPVPPPATSPAPEPATPSSSPVPPPATSPAPSPAKHPHTYVVGDALGWTVPHTSHAYHAWARNKTFSVGDLIVFNFPNGTQDVAELSSKAAYDSCNFSAATKPITTPPVRINLTTAGEHFYVCTISNHCSLGQKLAIKVTGAPARPPPRHSPAPSPAGAATPPPSGSATPPSGSILGTPSPAGVSAPPPPNSAASFAGAVMPITLLAVALAFLF